MMEGLSETLNTDLTTQVIGPHHPALPGPIKLTLHLDGEVVVSANVETGFLFRNLEKAFEQQPWRSALVFAEHLDPPSAFFGGLVLCQAVEEIGEIQIPARARRIRVIVSELARILIHFGYIARMAQIADSDVVTHFILRDREKIHDLLELLTGSRFARGYLKLGGVGFDMTAGFVERVLEACELIQVRMKEYNDLFSYHFAFVHRTHRVGRIDRYLVEKFGITGPNARAAGVAFDVRKQQPYLDYSFMDFEVPSVKKEKVSTGDIYDRYLMRLREISQSIEILKQACEAVPAGEYFDYKAERDFSIPRGESYGRVEGPRGLLSCHVISDGGINPARVQFQTPSQGFINVIPALLGGSRLEDVFLILASLDISVSELDR